MLFTVCCDILTLSFWFVLVTFILMMLLASLHNLSRTIGTAMLFTISGDLTFAVLVGEMILYHFYKFARRDYTLWIVGLEGSIRWICAFMTHTVVKTMVDFTGE